MPLAEVVQSILGNGIPLGVAAYDGSAVEPPDAVATLVIRSPDALSRIISRPGELGLSRAYVAGDLDIDGDIYSLLDIDISVSSLRLSPTMVARLIQVAGPSVLRLLPPPEEEARLHGGIHSRRRDRESISHHYDVSNTFYEMVLGPSMTYSSALFETAKDDLATAQENKYELVSRKLGLRSGMRLLDVGCGWGGMAIHAATNHGHASSASPFRANSMTGPRNAWPNAAWEARSRSVSRTTATLPTDRSMQSARSACSSMWVDGEWPSTSTGCLRYCGQEVGC